MRVGFVEWPEGLEPGSAVWSAIMQAVDAAAPDLLVTNEMPFGGWIASAAHFDRDVAARSVSADEEGVAALSQLPVPAILSSRPVWEGERLANEAIIIEAGYVRGIHRKQYFPAEPGWHETTWFGTASRGFVPATVGGIGVGVLLCTELMFNEHARSYGRLGASLIAVPRATDLSTDLWHAAGKMAAMVSGAYVVSSNRVGPSSGPTFGGHGFVYAPTGELLATTSADRPLAVFELDVALVEHQKREYPCYVAEQMAMEPID